MSNRDLLCPPSGRSILAAFLLFVTIGVFAPPSPAAVPVVAPKSLSFGAQAWNTTSTSKPVTLKNKTKTTIAPMAIVASSGFTITDFGTCNAPLPSHQSCTIMVAFKPTSVEAFIGTVAITAAHPAKPILVNLSGAGVAVNGQPAGHVLVAGGVDSNAILATAEIYDPISKSFSSAGTMSDSRAFETATWLDPAIVGNGALLHGLVMINGGEDNAQNIVNTTDLYDPISGFQAGNSSQVARAEGTATLITTGPLKGKVLITGGTTENGLNFDNVNSAEIFDPATGDFTSTGSMNDVRSEQTATVIACNCAENGDVLVAGGYDLNFNPLASAELFDATTKTFSCVGGGGPPCPAVMTNPRVEHDAAALADGKILITGGYKTFPNRAGSGPGTATADIYDPATNTMQTGLKMHHARQGHTATLIEGCNCPLDGAVLIASGADQTFRSTTSAELYIPGTGFVVTGSMKTGRVTAEATLFAPTSQFAGQVVIIGGAKETGPLTGVILKSAEIYDPITRKFYPAGSMSTPRQEQGQALIP